MCVCFRCSLTKNLEILVGRFTSPQEASILVAELAQSLAKEDFADLPQQIGKRQGANPHLYTVTFGKQSVVLILGAAPLPTPEADKGKPDATARMVGVVRTIEKLLAEPKKE